MSKAKTVYVSGKITVEVRRTLFGQKVTITNAADDVASVVTSERLALRELARGSNKLGEDKND